ncbi:MAG TPA: hypothetical protein VMT35_03925 [Ignavibacteriaceae bacterium]|nr:hypothetical protein [Ignavibacteriaceae bacterium]
MTEKEFISSRVGRILAEGLKNFPEDFNNLTDFCEINLPQKSLLIGTELFGKIEIISTDGSFIMHAEDYNQAKYIVYSSRQKIGKVKLPKNPDEIKSLLSRYEKYLDSILVLINTEYRKIFKEGNSDFAVNEIFRAINLVRY